MNDSFVGATDPHYPKRQLMMSSRPKSASPLPAQLQPRHCEHSLAKARGHRRRD
jgi:hypothetical protein